MKLKEIGEFGLIARLKDKVYRPDQRVIAGIGDDAAAVQVSGGQLLLLTTDVLVERVHFDRRIQSFRQIGWRTMVANVSDIAAMGGLPRHALVSICLPGTVSVEDTEEIYDGMQAVAAEHDFGIVGGDTVSSPRDLVISVCMTGEVSRKHLLTRKGAQAGDLICVTGELGGSQAGLAMLQAAGEQEERISPRLPDEEWSQVRERHLRPQARLREARVLAQSGQVHAMIDVSDGLAGEVSHIAQESDVGVQIIQEKIPIGPQTRRVAEHLGCSALDFALSGGEDFELVFTLSPKSARQIIKSIADQTGTSVSIVGKVLPAKAGIVLVSSEGTQRPLRAKGYQHF